MDFAIMSLCYAHVHNVTLYWDETVCASKRPTDKEVRAHSEGK